jgi:hypothetical protein
MVAKAVDTIFNNFFISFLGKLIYLKIADMLYQKLPAANFKPLGIFAISYGAANQYLCRGISK